MTWLLCQYIQKCWKATSNCSLPFPSLPKVAAIPLDTLLLAVSAFCCKLFLRRECDEHQWLDSPMTNGAEHGGLSVPQTGIVRFIIIWHRMKQSTIEELCQYPTNCHPTTQLSKTIGTIYIYIICIYRSCPNLLNTIAVTFTKMRRRCWERMTPAG